jgi:transcriptional regulator with XRE-family HTH domain
MITEKLYWPTEAEFASTSSLKNQLLQSLKTSDEYRYSFVEEKIQSGLAAQIRAIREQRELDPKQFADKLGKKVSWVYRLEDPNQPPPTIPSLLEVARAYDVDLEVRFRPFSAFLNETDNLSTKSLEVASFKDELPELERETACGQNEYWAPLREHAAMPASFNYVYQHSDIELGNSLQMSTPSSSVAMIDVKEYPAKGNVIPADVFRKHQQRAKSVQKSIPEELRA